jgi:hypothetical protein
VWVTVEGSEAEAEAGLGVGSGSRDLFVTQTRPLHILETNGAGEEVREKYPYPRNPPLN